MCILFTSVCIYNVINILEQRNIFASASFKSIITTTDETTKHQTSKLILNQVMFKLKKLTKSQPTLVSAWKAPKHTNVPLLNLKKK